MIRARGSRPLHRTLVTTAVAVAAAASALTLAGSLAVDLWRYRDTASDDTRALASVIAENAAAAVVFGDVEEARSILASAGVRPTVQHSCLYLPDGTLFARFERPGGSPCPPRPEVAFSWFSVAGQSPVVRDRTLGTVLVERELPELWLGLGITAGIGLVMVILAGIVASVIAARLHRRVSEPIEQLAGAVRTIGPEALAAPPPVVHTGLPEIRDLSRAFADMLARIAEATAALKRKEAEREDLLRREREANRVKDEFLAAVSHELRTPLNAILGWSQILATTPVDQATTSRAIASIARNARAQTRLIEDLVDVSRIVTGKLAVRFDPVDLRDAVDSAVEVIRAAAAAKRIVVRTDLPPEPCPVSGDRDRLQQIFANLLSNAVKFTPAGGSIQVTLRALAGIYETDVRDDGIGIPAGLLEDVFEPFRQADGSTTREHGGLGLGLAIVRELTTLHRGSVRAASDGRGLGTTFTVRLPALDMRQPAAEPPPPEPSIERTLDGLRVLAVDDNADALDVLKATLERAGAVVRTARSGREAVESCAQEPPDVLLCDISMPDMDGFEVLRRVRDGRPPQAWVPAVAVSAHATDQHRARSAAVGFNEHLAKPFTLAALVGAVERARHVRSGT